MMKLILKGYLSQPFGLYFQTLQIRRVAFQLRSITLISGNHDYTDMRSIFDVFLWNVKKPVALKP